MHPLPVRVLATLLILTTVAQATQSTNHVLHAVPAPAKVTLDGSLDEWDLCGQFEVFANYRLRHTYSTKVAAMYDAEYFYLAIVWRDPSPMHNLVDSRYDAGSGWRSDCLQLRIRTDMTMHVDAWYSTAAEQPVCTVAYGRFSKGTDKQEDVDLFVKGRADIMARGGKQGFRLGEDGKSYVQELALPWTAITGQAAILKETGQPFRPPKTYGPGDSFRMGMEFLWGQPDGKTFPIHRYADLLDEQHTDREFFWTAERAWGTVKLEPKGNLDLPQPDYVADDTFAQRTAGPVALRYTLPADGFVTLVVEDEQGNRVKNVVGMAPRSAGEQVDYWDGSDESGKLAAPGGYRWRGLFHTGVTPTYQASYGSPGQPVWDTADGKGAWMSDHNAPVAVAASGDRMVLAAGGSEAGWAMIATDLDGRKQWGERKFQGIVAVAADDTYIYTAMDGHGQSPAIGRCRLKDAAYAPFATAAGEQLIVPLLGEGEKGQLAGVTILGDQVVAAIRGADELRFYDRATMAPVKRLPAIAPGGLHAVGDVLWLIVGSQVARLEGDRLVPVVTAGLEQPVDLTIDAEGMVYVTDQGSQRIEVFAPDGKPVRSIGAEGGRPKPGTWVREALRNPAGIDLDAQGRLWVAEADKGPKRISVWTRDGAFVREFIGPTGYGGMGAFADPQDATRLFGSGCEWRLDPATQTAIVVGNPLSGVPTGDLLRCDGREYFMSKRQMLYVRDGERYRPVASFGQVAEQTAEAVANAGERGGKPVYNYLWSDGNGDGVVDLGECHFQPVDGKPWNTGYWGGYWLDEDFNLTMVPGGYQRLLALRIPRTGWTDGGAPVWDAAKLAVVHDSPLPGGPSKLLLGRRDMIVAGYTPITGIRPADGSIAWTYANPWNDVHGSHRSPIPADDSMVIGLLSCIGTAASPVGELFAVNSNMGRLYVMTTDGLLAATVFNDCRIGSEPWPKEAKQGTPLGNVTMGGEWFGGYFYRTAADGRYHLIAGGTSYNLIRLEGLETLRRLDGGSVTLDAAGVIAAQQLQEQRAAAAAQAKTLTIARLDQPPTVDGDLREYAKESRVAWRSGNYQAEGAVAIAGDLLCLAWQVRGDANPLVNGGKDVTHLFITGDSVDLQLGTDPDAKADRADAVPGDLRLLITEFQGQPVAVLYRFRVPGATAKVTFRSPWRSYDVDAVDVVEEARVGIRRQKDGYTVEATVPLARLGYAPVAGKRYRLDLGVIFSDAKGDNRASRVYWANPATGLVNDVPGEIMPVPRLWGEANVK